MTVDDTGAPLTAGPGCDQPTPAGAVSCSVTGLYIVFVHLGDGSDTLAVDNQDPSVQFTEPIGAGEGADSVDVGPLGEVCLDGNAGVDQPDAHDSVEGITIDGGEGGTCSRAATASTGCTGAPIPHRARPGRERLRLRRRWQRPGRWRPRRRGSDRRRAWRRHPRRRGRRRPFRRWPRRRSSSRATRAPTRSHPASSSTPAMTRTRVAPGRDRLVYFCRHAGSRSITPPTTADPRSGRPTTSTSRHSRFPRACRPILTRATRATTTAPATTRWSGTRRTTSSSRSAVTIS